MDARSRYSFIKINDLNSDEYQKNIFLSFLDQTKEIVFQPYHAYPFKDSQGQSVDLIVDHVLFKIPGKTINDINQNFYYGKTELGKGSFGTVYEGLGRLRIKPDTITTKRTMNCDFIYASPSCQASLDELLQQCQSKTAFLLINNSLFYLDKSTYLPKTAMRFISDLNDNELSALTEKFHFDQTSQTIQQQGKLSEETLKTDLLPYYHQQSKKPFVIKVQDHSLRFNSTDAEREAFYAKKTPHLGPVKGPFFAHDRNVSFMKQNKKRGKSLQKILEEEKNLKFISYEQRIRLTLALFEALESQFHAKGMIHRDLKPDNILIDLDTMSVSIIDTGTCKGRNEETNENVGNIYFGSPERCKETFTDEKSDSYSLAKIIAELWAIKPDYPTLKPDSGKTDIRESLMRHIADNDTTFTQAAYQIIDPNQVAPLVKEILKQMCLCNHEARWDLQAGKQAFQKLEAVKRYTSEQKLIMELDTIKKLQKIRGKAFIKSDDVKLAALKDSAIGKIMDDSMPPLYAAAASGNMETVKSLLNLGANVNESYNGKTPLFLAIEKGDTDMASLLIEHRADVSQGIEINKSLVLSMVYSQGSSYSVKNLDCIFYLYQVKDTISNFTPLHAAVCLNNTKMVNLLLKNGAKPDGMVEKNDEAIKKIPVLDFTYLTMRKNDLLPSASLEEKRLNLLREHLFTIAIPILTQELGTSQQGYLLTNRQLTETGKAIINLIKSRLSDSASLNADIFDEIDKLIPRPRYDTFESAASKQGKMNKKLCLELIATIDRIKTDLELASPRPGTL